MTPAERAQILREAEYEELTGQRLHKLAIDGRAATGYEAKRILTAKAEPVEKDRSTASISNNRGFSLLK